MQFESCFSVEEQMYDPLIVDAFIEVHGTLTSLQTDAREQAIDGLAAITRGTASSDTANTGPALDDISSRTEEMMILYDLAKNLSGPLAFTEAAEVVSNHLRRIVPAAVCVFFIYDSVADEIRATYASGDNAGHFTGTCIPRGQRLSGWVAANLKTIVNSDPILDLGEAARRVTPRLLSCLATPLIAERQLIGVLSRYSVERDHFTEDHRRIIEVVARQASKSIKSALESEMPTAGDSDEHQADVATRGSRRGSSVSVPALRAAHISILVVQNTITPESDRSTRHLEAYLHRALSVIEREFSASVELLRYTHRESLILIRDAAPDAANLAARIITEHAGEFGPSSEDHHLAFNVGVATAPRDGDTIEELVATARQRTRVSHAVPPTRHFLH